MIDWPVQFVESKYSRWYDALIQKAQLRGTVEGYSEDHHIIPRSFGGSDSIENLVTLTAKEHYIAHALLWKMNFNLEFHNKMSYALRLMIFGSGAVKQLRKYKCHSRIYETVRKEFSRYHSKNMSGENNPFYGKKHSPETMEKIKTTKKRTGNYGGNQRKSFDISVETRAKISKALKGRTWEMIVGSERAEELKRKMSENTRNRCLGTVQSEETRKKISEKAKGRIPYNKGVKGIVKQTPETIAKRLSTMKTNGKTSHNKVMKICENCNIEVKANVYSRCHGPKCKTLKKDKNE